MWGPPACSPLRAGARVGAAVRVTVGVLLVSTLGQPGVPGTPGPDQIQVFSGPTKGLLLRQSNGICPGCMEGPGDSVAPCWGYVPVPPLMWPVWRGEACPPLPDDVLLRQRGLRPRGGRGWEVPTWRLVLLPLAHGNKRATSMGAVRARAATWGLLPLLPGRRLQGDSKACRGRPRARPPPSLSLPAWLVLEAASHPPP